MPFARVLAILGLVLVGGCSANSFPTVTRCPDGGCTPCATDDDCFSVVDCCQQVNVCGNKADPGGAVCRMACPEVEPLTAKCVNTQCQCQ